MKHIREVLEKLLNQKITIDEAEGMIDYFIFSYADDIEEESEGERDG